MPTIYGPAGDLTWDRLADWIEYGESNNATYLHRCMLQYLKQTNNFESVSKSNKKILTKYRMRAATQWADSDVPMQPRRNNTIINANNVVNDMVFINALQHETRYANARDVEAQHLIDAFLKQSEVALANIYPFHAMQAPNTCTEATTATVSQSTSFTSSNVYDSNTIESLCSNARKSNEMLSTSQDNGPQENDNNIANTSGTGIAELSLLITG